MMNSKCKPTWDLDSDEAYISLQEKFHFNQTVCAVLLVLWAGSVLVAAPIIAWLIPATKLPVELRPFLNPYVLIFALGIPTGLLLSLTPVGKEAKNYKRIGPAINAFERAREHYVKWEAKHKRNDLRKCQEYMKLAAPYLGGVPMYLRVQAQVDAALRETA